LWRERQFRRLLNLIDHLPANWFFNEERVNDPEIAEAMAKLPETEYEERLINWSPESALMAQSFDRLGQLINAVVIMAGGKQVDIKPLPRPVTEIQRARERVVENDAREFAARMTNPLTP
jgi:hypothetical protein